MTVKQLKSLIAAGAFSATLLAGVAYADDSTTPKSSAPDMSAPGATTDTSAPAMTAKPKHMKHHKKSMAKNACAGQNGCKGQGGCKTGDSGCKGKNSCKGKGGCATDGSK